MIQLPPVKTPQSPVARFLSAVGAVLVIAALMVIGTVALGVFLVLGLVAYLWFRWRIYRMRKQAQQGKTSAAEDDGIIDVNYTVVHESRVHKHKDDWTD